jgi:acyl-CoA dehydrogenase
MKRFEDQGRPAADLPLLHWSMQLSVYRIQESLHEIIRHFPIKPIGWILRAIIFPLGRRHSKPSDQIGQQIATLMMIPGEARDRLIDGIYNTQNPSDPTGRVEYALSMTLQAEPIEKRLRDAGLTCPYNQTYKKWVAELYKKGLVSDHDESVLQESHHAVREAIRVDDFPQEGKASNVQHDQAA